jgi:hypothetical protein
VCLNPKIQHDSETDKTFILILTQKLKQIWQVSYPQKGYLAPQVNDHRCNSLLTITIKETANWNIRTYTLTLFHIVPNKHLNQNYVFANIIDPLKSSANYTYRQV